MASKAASDPAALKAQHPLVTLLFWALGQDIKKGSETSLPLAGDEDPALNDPLKERTLSWKDEKINGAPLTTTNTWIDDFGEVEAHDIPLKKEEDFKGPLKPKVLMVQAGESSSAAAEGSPNSPNNWGFFVSITPPQAELFAKAKLDASASK